jgi:hypothetical protein
LGLFVCLFVFEGFELAKQALYCSSHTSSPFCSNYFGDRVPHTICLSDPPNLSLPSTYDYRYESPSQPMAWMHACIPATKGSTNRMTVVQSGPDIKGELISTNTKRTRASLQWYTACLMQGPEFNSSTTKTQKKPKKMK